MGYVAYFQLNIDYIIETYCINKEKPEMLCNGKCHLANQLNTTPIDDTEPSSYVNSLFEAFVPVYFQEHPVLDYFKQYMLPIENNWNYNTCFSSLFRDIVSPPPQV